MVRAESAGPADAMTMSCTEKGGLGGTRQSETFYYTGFGKGDEIADYSWNYKTDGETVRNATIFYYGTAEVEASASGVMDAMTRSDTRRDSLAGTLQNQTYYYTGFGKGDEIADYSYNYRTDGATIRNVSIFFYGTDEVRAASADSSDPMSRTDSRRESLTGVLEAGTLQSQTYYYTGFGKGDEIANYAFNYRTDGATIKNVSIFYYGTAETRAEFSSTADAMSRSDSLKESLAGVLQSQTYYYTGFGKGDEIADYSLNYTFDGSRVKSTSIFYYGTAETRADAPVRGLYERGTAVLPDRRNGFAGLRAPLVLSDRKSVV